MGTRIILVSHALTQWNVDRRIQGHTDVPLNKTGLVMADRLANRLVIENISAIYTSDLRRAYETALPTAALKCLDIIQDMQLREGRSIHQETSDQYPMLPFTVDVEVEEDLLKRMVTALSGIAQHHDQKTILVVSHGGAIEIFLEHLLESAGDSPSAYSGIRMALNTITYSAGKWQCNRLNDDAHLSTSVRP